MKKLYFLINPKARNGYCLKIWERVEQTLTEGKISFQKFFTEYQGHANILATQIASSTTEEIVIIAVGGDGTMHEVVNGTVQYNNVTLGFVPGGSGNDFSRGFLIPVDPMEALQVILRLVKKDAAQIDVGKVNMNDHSVHYFINNMGAGFDALVSQGVNQSRMKAILNKLSLGRLVYVYVLLKELFTYNCTTINLSIDEKIQIYEKTWFVTVSNQPYYGGGMKIAPEAVPDDGLLDITIVHRLSRIKLLLVFISVFWGKHVLFKEVKSFRGRKISLHSSSPLYVHADGEIIGYTPLNIQIQTRKIKVLSSRENKGEVNLKERDSSEC
jgi:diacylglycerol kinase (ATP)